MVTYKLNSKTEFQSNDPFKSYHRFFKKKLLIEKTSIKKSLKKKLSKSEQFSSKILIKDFDLV